MPSSGSGAHHLAAFDLAPALDGMAATIRPHGRGRHCRLAWSVFQSDLAGDRGSQAWPWRHAEQSAPGTAGLPAGFASRAVFLCPVFAPGLLSGASAQDRTPPCRSATQKLAPGHGGLNGADYILHSRYSGHQTSLSEILCKPVVTHRHLNGSFGRIVLKNSWHLRRDVNYAQCIVILRCRYDGATNRWPGAVVLRLQHRSYIGALHKEQETVQQA